jgi:integrase
VAISQGVGVARASHPAETDPPPAGQTAIPETGRGSSDAIAADDDVALTRELATLARGPGVLVDRELLRAYAAAAAPNTLRAFRADVSAFDTWCRVRGLKSLPASPQTLAAFLQHRAGQGAAPASLTRYRASIAKLHRLCRMPDPGQDELVKLTMAAHRRDVGAAQAQARPLRFRGSVKDPLSDSPRGINVRAALETCETNPTGLRDKALLSVAYDTGLRASELVAIQFGDIRPAIDPDARLLHIARSKGDQDGEGATAYLSPRSVTALEAWLAAADIKSGPIFRRVIVRRYKARAARGRINANARGWNARWDKTWFTGRAAQDARIEYDIGTAPLHPGSITPIFRGILRRAFEAGAFGDLSAAAFEAQLKQISAHSTRVGVNQDYFASGENLAGIMDALRWKSPRMPLLYNRNLAAEQGAAGRLLGKLK